LFTYIVYFYLFLAQGGIVFVLKSALYFNILCFMPFNPVRSQPLPTEVEAIPSGRPTWWYFQVPF